MLPLNRGPTSTQALGNAKMIAEDAELGMLFPVLLDSNASILACLASWDILPPPTLLKAICDPQLPMCPPILVSTEMPGFFFFSLLAFLFSSLLFKPISNT